jgi:hypothetical protein
MEYFIHIKDGASSSVMGISFLKNIIEDCWSWSGMLKSTIPIEK